MKQGGKYMKTKWLLLQLDWKNTDKDLDLHNIKGSIRKEFDDKDKLKAYVDFIKDARKMGEIPMNIGFTVVKQEVGDNDE